MTEYNTINRKTTSVLFELMISGIGVNAVFCSPDVLSTTRLRQRRVMLQSNIVIVIAALNGPDG